MKLSLKMLFAVLTISCMVALVYQERQNLARLSEQNAELSQKIEGYPKHLETTLPLVKKSVVPDHELDKVYAQVVAYRELENQNFIDAEVAKANTVSILHIPELEYDWKRFEILVPPGKLANLQIFASPNPFSGGIEKALEKSVFALSKTVNMPLAEGIWSLKIQPVEDTPEERNGVWNLTVNGELVATTEAEESGLSGQNVIWDFSEKKKTGLTLRHQNVRDRVSRPFEPSEAYVEFAAIYSTDFYKQLATQPDAQPTYLVFAISIEGGEANE